MIHVRPIQIPDLAKAQQHVRGGTGPQTKNYTSFSDGRLAIPIKKYISNGNHALSPSNLTPTINRPERADQMCRNI